MYLITNHISSSHVKECQLGHRMTPAIIVKATKTKKTFNKRKIFPLNVNA